MEEAISTTKSNKCNGVRLVVLQENGAALYKRGGRRRGLWTRRSMAGRGMVPIPNLPGSMCSGMRSYCIEVPAASGLRFMRSKISRIPIRSCQAGHGKWAARPQLRRSMTLWTSLILVETSKILMLLLPHHPAVSSARTVGTKCDGVAEPRRNGLVREADGGEQG